jgi:hypothetical protein
MRPGSDLARVVKRILPARVSGALSRLKHGGPKAKVPGMIRSAEASFYDEAAARYLGREGAIVDLGCWLGATSIALARGLSKSSVGRPPHPERVVGFDLFVWEDWMPARLPYGRYRPGDSFLPEARRLVEEHGGGYVELRREDLSVYEWREGPIKILLVDAMKTEALARQIARTFYPHLSVGALLIHQDFKHFFTTWIHILQYRLRNHCRFARSVPAAATVAFEVIAPMPEPLLERATAFADLSDDDVEASFDHSLSLVEDADRTNIAAAHVMHYVRRGQSELARARLERYRRLGMSDRGDFPKVVRLLEQVG